MSLQENQQKTPSKVLIVSAEPSSNLYAERIMEECTSRKLSIDFWGIGNQKMEDYGLTRFGKSEEMAVMGFQEVLKHYKDIKAVYNEILEEAKKGETKVAILMDYAEFNLKLSKDLHQLGVKVVFYIAPQIWAWRQGRVKQVREFVDELLCIFPFEESFYKKHGVKTQFVGHPLLDEIKESQLDLSQRELKRSKKGIEPGAPVLGLLPGSRKSELSLNFRAQLDTAKILKDSHPNLVVVVLAAPGMDQDLIRSYIELDDPEIIVLQDEPFEMLQVVDFALVASGTATLVTGLMQVPMLVMYKMKPVSAFLAKLLVSKNNPFFAMINLIFGKEFVPERFQNDANPKAMARLIEEKWFDDVTYQATKEEIKELPKLLGSKGATNRVVDHLEAFL